MRYNAITSRFQCRHYTIYVKCIHKSHIFNLLVAKITKMYRANNKDNELHGHFSHLHYYSGKRMSITSIVLLANAYEETAQKIRLPFFSACINKLVRHRKENHTKISQYVFRIFIVSL